MLDVEDVPLVLAVVELRIDCSNCCMTEELLTLETLKTVSPLSLDGAPAAAGDAEPLGALRVLRKTFQVSVDCNPATRPLTRLERLSRDHR